MPAKEIERGTEWTPEPVPCGFCGWPDEGYAKKDKNGKWKPACWSCVKPAKTIEAIKKKTIEYPPMEDLDTDDIIKPRSFIFDVPRISTAGMTAIRNRIAARKAGKILEEPAEIVAQEKVNDSTSSDRKIHTRRTKLATMDAPTNERAGVARVRK